MAAGGDRRRKRKGPRARRARRNRNVMSQIVAQTMITAPPPGPTAGTLASIARRVTVVSRTLKDELLSDMVDGAGLTEADFAAIGRELGHLGNQLLDSTPMRRCLDCAEPFRTALDVASRLCVECRPRGWGQWS